MEFQVFSFSDGGDILFLRIPSGLHLQIAAACQRRGLTAEAFFEGAIRGELRAFRADATANTTAAIPPEARDFQKPADQTPLFAAGKRDGLNRLRRPRTEVRTIRRGNEPLFTVAEVAFRLSMGRSTVGRLITDGELACLRTSKGGKSIRIPEHAIQDFVAALGRSIKTRTQRIA
jgi:excisionase family DNA binding protein